MGVLERWTDVWALVSLSNADVRHRACPVVEVTRTAFHTFSAVYGRPRHATFCRSLSRGWALLTSSPIHHDTVHRGLAAHCVDGSRTVGHDKSAVGVFEGWTDVWALVSLSNADVRHRACPVVEVTRTAFHTFSAVYRCPRHATFCRSLSRGRTLFTRSPIHHDTIHRGLAAHCVDGPRTVGHDKSAVGVFDMWTEEWVLVSLSNADLRHRASHRVCVTRTASHTFSTVSGWEGWAIMGRYSQGSGDESEEQERHLEAFSARPFSHVLYIDTTA